MVLWKESNKQVKESIDTVADNLRNPFDDMYNWCKGELYDLHALSDAVLMRENIEKYVKKLEQKKRDLQTDLDNVQTGKKSVRTLLKNQSDTGNMTNQIELTEKEIENQQTLLELVTIYLGERVIPQFKNEKIQVYTKMF